MVSIGLRFIEFSSRRRRAKPAAVNRYHLSSSRVDVSQARLLRSPPGSVLTAVSWRLTEYIQQDQKAATAVICLAGRRWIA